MKNKAFGFLAVFMFFACTSVKQPIVKQGITGYIYLVKGNQMPVFGRPQKDKGKGVSRDIYFYEPTTIREVTGSTPVFSSIKTRLVTRTKSDTSGRYTIALPGGKYSVFVDVEGRYFAGIMDGNGVLNPVTVFREKVNSYDITITHNATY